MLIRCGTMFCLCWWTNQLSVVVYVRILNFYDYLDFTLKLNLIITEFAQQAEFIIFILAWHILLSLECKIYDICSAVVLKEHSEVLTNPKNHFLFWLHDEMKMKSSVIHCTILPPTGDWQEPAEGLTDMNHLRGGIKLKDVLETKKQDEGKWGIFWQTLLMNI